MDCNEAQAELDAERVRCESEAARVGELNTTLVGLGEEVRRCVEERDSVQASRDTVQAELNAERGRREAEAARSQGLHTTLTEMGVRVERCVAECGGAKDELQRERGGFAEREAVAAAAARRWEEERTTLSAAVVALKGERAEMVVELGVSQPTHCGTPFSPAVHPSHRSHLSYTLYPSVCSLCT